ncbi:MAG TPA: GH25 family lysozyme, partial [Bacteroidia bacterium]
MRKLIILFFTIKLFCTGANAQQCLNTGFCTTIANEHQYPTTTFSTTSSTWILVSAYMNADNYTLFNVTSGNVYEWSYCEAYGGVSTGWDAQLTLSDNSAGTDLCFSDNSCGTTGNAPYISWTATFTGVVKLLTSQAGCAGNSGSPYNTLVWRMANGTPSTQILGVDVSSYEGAINWNNVKAAGYKFAFAKATEGVTITDSYFVQNEVNGTAAGLPIG